MGGIIKWFTIVQAVCAFLFVFFIRFFDYLVSNAVTVMMKPLVPIAILVTILFSLILSAACLFKYKAGKGSLIPVWINLCTIFLLFLPLRDWGIRYNFEKYYEQRNAVVKEYSKEKFDGVTEYIMPGAAGDFQSVASQDRIGVLGQDGKLCFYFSLYDGILGTSEGFLYITDASYQSGSGMLKAELYYGIKENWYFGSCYRE